MNSFTIRDLISYNTERKGFLQLKIVTGDTGLENQIDDLAINRPGLALSGFLTNFAYQQIQLFGRSEASYLSAMPQKIMKERLALFFRYEINLCVFTHGKKPPPLFIEKARNRGTAILITRLTTQEMMTLLNFILETRLAPRKSVHGVLIEVFGEGCLITGPSGVGKSETALELVKRGHRLIADDLIHVRKVAGSMLIGSPDPLIQHNLEIRGLGIIDVMRVFGVGAIKPSKRVGLALRLEEWVPGRRYNRLGYGIRYKSYLGVKIPSFVVPVKSGRNIPVIIETAAVTQRLKDLGHDAARELSQRLKARIRKGRKG